MQEKNGSNSAARIFFYATWLIISLIQAGQTELSGDEAYYWKYAQNMAWGYFDHPPMVAAFIKAGYTFFQNELGVRLFFVLSSLLFIYVLELLTRPKNATTFYLAINGIGVFHILGFAALPDMPLLFFTATFLYLYKQYVNYNKLWQAILLAVNIALLFYSKYHAVLIVGFTILAWPAVMKRGTFWLISLLSAVLFLPHVFWQFNNGLPSISYHLAERSQAPYNIEYTLSYLLSILLIFGPLTGLVLGWQILTKKPSDRFDRTLRYVSIGILCFFFFMSFKGRTEANWIAIAVIPAFIYGYPKLEQKVNFKRFIKTSFFISTPLLLLLRLYLIVDLLPNATFLDYARNKIHNTKAWTAAIKDKAGDKPVVFMNRYQYAAQYEFYTGMNAISLNNRMGRKNQYNIWKDEQELQGKYIMLVPNYQVHWMDTINTPKGVFQYQYINNFRSATPIEINYVGEDHIKANRGDSVEIQFTITSNIADWKLEANKDYYSSVHALFFQKDKLAYSYNTGFQLTDSMLFSKNTLEIKVKVPETPGTYTLYTDVSAGWLPASINTTQPITITIH